MIVLEVGINHFGIEAEAKKYLDFFLKSNFNYLTFQIQSQKFYKKFEKKINFKLPKEFYFYAIQKARSIGKKIGLAVCDLRTFKEYLDLKFDFYKLLGVAINNYELIAQLPNKDIFISLAIADDKKIFNCIQKFRNFNKLNLIYTNMSYSARDLNLSRINHLKKKFKLPVGYGHHFNSIVPLFVSKCFKPDFYFLYIKLFSKKKRIYPDNDHAFFIDKIPELCRTLDEIDIYLENKNLNYKIKLNDKKIHI